MVSNPQHEAERLLNVLDPLPYPQRMRELALLVRELGPLRPLLEELEGRGPYERGIAVIAAAVTRDVEWIAERLADPDAFVRGHALRAADSLQVPDAAYEVALTDAPEVVRRELVRAITAGRRTALADRLVDGLRRDWGDAEAARLLPGCTPGTVARLLPELFHAVRRWKALARRHPGALIDAVERELTALPAPLTDPWWKRYGQSVAAVAGAEPLRVLELLERFGTESVLYEIQDHFGTFAAVEPGRLLKILVTPAWHESYRGRWVSPTTLRRLARSGAPELAAYGRVLADADDLAPLVSALPPARRHAFFTAAYEGWGGGPEGIDADLLEALPRSCVADEARRMSAVAREQGTRWSSLLLAESYLPVAEVRDRLVEATRRPSSEDRAQAWPLLIRNAERSGDPLTVAALLADMGRLRNEQDPVRSSALRALSEVKPALFTEDAEPHLDRIAVDAVQAPDSSPGSRQLLSALALSVLREHAACGSRELVNWSLRTLVRISGSTGGADLGRLDRTLRRGQEHRVHEALRPWIEAGAEKGDYSLAFALARAVGRRAADMPELQETLWQAVRYGDDATARTAIDLWLAPRATRDERVARVLALEASAAALPSVLRILTLRRTDLLDLLSDTLPYGRFLTKSSPWTVPVDRGVRRWVPRQQRAAARQLADRAADTGLPLYRRAEAVEQSALVPGEGTEGVRRWTGSHDVVLAEAALAALARADRPADALPELLAHADGDRARVAVYAATRASRHEAPSLLAAHLRGVLLAPDAKVTGRKEAVRLAATRLPLSQAAALLAETYDRPGTHLDVRTACVAFAGGLLTEEPVWALLHDAARAEPVLRTAVLRVSPLDLPEPHRERYARLVQDVCSTDDAETANLAFGALARWEPWSPDAATVLADAVADLSQRTFWRAAATGLVTVAAGSARGELGLLRALTALAEAETAVTPETDAVSADRANASVDAGERRDRPARRRIAHLVAHLCPRAARSAAGPIGTAAVAAGELLAGYDDFVPQAAALLARHLDLGPELHGLERLAALTAGRPALAARTAQEAAGRLRWEGYDWESEVLLDAARRLTGHGGHGEGLIAVALTGAIGGRSGWSEPWRERLRVLRRHPVADVRDVALDRATAHE